MSRIGKKIIMVPEKTGVEVSGDRVLVKGPLGELSR
ncbi:MAG: 50S ribosomal protein L6, partial [Minisyncoccia bacterium]